MKYKIYIDENNNLIWRRLLIKAYRFPVTEIREFTIDTIRVTKGYDATPMFFGGQLRAVFTQHVLKNPMGNIIISFKEESVRTKFSKKSTITITNYKYVQIKNIDNVFKVAEDLIDYGFHYCRSLIYKEIRKSNNSGNKTLTKSYYFTSRGKSKETRSEYTN